MEKKGNPICKTVALKLRTDLPVKKSPLQFRDYIINNYPDKKIVQFLEQQDGSDPQYYPVIQIKILQGIPVIIGINEGIEPVLELKNLFSVMDFGNITFRIMRVDVEEKEYELKTTEKPLIYQFMTPWVALNDENSIRFKYYYDNERTAFLNSILNKNLLFVARFFKIPMDRTVVTRLKVKSLNPMPVNGSPHGGFWGGFSCNMILPNLIGIGNGILHGYGTIYSKNVEEILILKELEEEKSAEKQQ